MSDQRSQASTPAGFNVKVTHDEQVATVCAEGDVDVLTVTQLRAALADAVGSGRHVLIDLCGCRFMDSSGLGELLRAQRLAAAGDASLAVVCLPGSVPARVIQLAAANAFPVHPSRAAALAKLRGTPARTPADPGPRP